MVISRGILALIQRRAKLFRQTVIDLVRPPLFPGGHFRCQQAEQGSVLVRTPGAAVEAEEGSPRTFLTAHTATAVRQIGNEPFEADRDFDDLASQLPAYPVQHGAGHQGLADTGIGPPLEPAAEKMPGHGGQIVIGIHQTAFGHDAVAVRVRVTGKSQIEAVAHPKQAAHDIGRGTVHPDLAVLVTGDKTERGINDLVDHGQAQLVALGYGFPQREAGTPQRIDPQGDAGSSDAVHIQDARQIFHIAGRKIITVHQRRTSGTAVWQAVDVTIEMVEIAVGPVFDPGIMGGRDDDTISQALAAGFAVPAQDGMGDRGGRRGGAVVGDAHLDIIGCQDFKSAAKGRFRQGVRIPAHEQRAGDAVLFAVVADGLGDGLDVAFVEGLFQRGATVPGCTKGHTLRSLVRIGGFRVVGTDERGNIFQCLGRRQLAGMGMYCHDVSSCPFSTVSPADPQASKNQNHPQSGWFALAL